MFDGTECSEHPHSSLGWSQPTDIQVRGRRGNGRREGRRGGREGGRDV